jgi:hypothetical protein
MDQALPRLLVLIGSGELGSGERGIELSDSVEGTSHRVAARSGPT